MFKLLQQSDNARRGTLKTAHGKIETPFFLTIGTAGAVKGLIPDEVRGLGGQVILANTYHLHLRPGEDIIEKAGGLPEATTKVINGGPMMGKALSTLDVPVVKGSSGILLIDENEARRKEVKPCIRCTKCLSVCPLGLEPYLLMTLSERSLFERMEPEKVMDCIECGSCSYTCPSSRPLLDYIRLGKAEVGKIMRARKAV